MLRVVRRRKLAGDYGCDEREREGEGEGEGAYGGGGGGDGYLFGVCEYSDD